MLSVLPVALSLSAPAQINPYPALCKRATLTVVLSHTSNGNPRTGWDAASDHSLVAIGPPKPFLPDIQQLTFLIPSLSLCDTRTSAPCPDPCPAPVYQPSSSFPVHGPFDLMYCVQNGSFGSAWAARDQSTGRLLCLKVFHHLHNLDIKRTIRMELNAHRRLVKSQGEERGKQFIIELNRSMQLDDTVLFAMELMTADLATYLSTDEGRCEMHARQWMAQIALGIEFLHEMGIIHRDIKSENILIDSRENVRIIDFGLSYLSPTAIPRQGDGCVDEFLGTPTYMAPEMLCNKDAPAHQKRSYGAPIDWWALGCILFELESQGHLKLFNTEEDVHAYVAWTQRPSQLDKKYSLFEDLDPVALNLLEGLLRVQPSTRYSLNDMEKHEYFLRPDGTREFDDAPARALDRPIRPELVPQITDEDKPVSYMKAAKMSSIYDWTNLNWALA